MNHRLQIVGLMLAAAAAGCTGSDSPTVPDTPTPVVGNALLYEPLSFCLTGTETSDTLFVENLTDGDLVWTPIRVPEGSTGLSEVQTITPDVRLGLLWTWDPPGSDSVLDSLVVETNDTTNAVVTIPFYRPAPGEADINPPGSPILVSPPDGATFAVSDTFLVRWTALDDCSDIAQYVLQISTDPRFNPNTIVLESGLRQTVASLIVDPGDVGVAHWRVYAKDKRGFTGVPSAARSWTVVP